MAPQRTVTSHSHAPPARPPRRQRTGAGQPQHRHSRATPSALSGTPGGGDAPQLAARQPLSPASQSPLPGGAGSDQGQLRDKVTLSEGFRAYQEPHAFPNSFQKTSFCLKKKEVSYCSHTEDSSARPSPRGPRRTAKQRSPPCGRPPLPCRLKSMDGCLQS